MATQCALVEIEMFLANDVIGIGTTQDGAEFLPNRDKDGDHGLRCFT